MAICPKRISCWRRKVLAISKAHMSLGTHQRTVVSAAFCSGHLPGVYPAGT